MEESKKEKKRQKERERLVAYRARKAKELGRPYHQREKTDEAKKQRSLRLKRERSAQYRASHREELKQHRASHREEAKQYRAKHREQSKQYSRTQGEKTKNIPHLREAASIRSRKWSKENPLLCALSHYKSSCKHKRSLTWEISDDCAIQLFNAKCHYCGIEPAPRNGIDRKDNYRGYEPDNVIACCSVCNTGKGSMSYEQFRRHLRQIAEYVCYFGIGARLRSNTRSMESKFAKKEIQKYQWGAASRGHQWSISNEMAIQLFLSDCHYCGIDPAPRNGIDRKDNERGYEANNVVACCAKCNFCKHTMSYEKFLAYLQRISDHVLSHP